MATESRQPELLRDLWAVLGNDPTRIADCFARPALAERLAREWYASDDRFHGDLEAQARADLAGMQTLNNLQGMSGEYAETTWQLGDPDRADPTSEAWVLNATDWATERETLAQRFSATKDTIPTGQVSALQEDDSNFYVVVVVEQNETTMRLATVRWHKQPFETWWATERKSFSTEVRRYPATIAYRK